MSKKRKNREENYHKANYREMCYVVPENGKMTQEEASRQHRMDEYREAIEANERSCLNSMQAGDYGQAISFTEQIAENDFKMVAVKNENLSPELENSHDLVALYEQNPEVFPIAKQSDIKGLKKNYYCKYPNQHSRPTEEQVKEALENAKKIADAGLKYCEQ